MREIVKAWPPNIEAIRAALPLEGSQPVFAWGPTLFNPYGLHVDPHLVIHEATHAIRQEEVGGPSAWWERYLADPQFRFDEEVLAFRHQYVSFCQFHKDRNRRARYLHALAKNLASPLYGSLATHAEALTKIST